jgi:hypothetical protein
MRQDENVPHGAGKHEGGAFECKGGAQDLLHARLTSHRSDGESCRGSKGARTCTRTISQQPDQSKVILLLVNYIHRADTFAKYIKIFYVYISIRLSTLSKLNLGSIYLILWAETKMGCIIDSFKLGLTKLFWTDIDRSNRGLVVMVMTDVSVMVIPDVSIDRLN